MTTFALKGNICYSTDKDTLNTMENGVIVCEDGVCRGVFPHLPEKYTGISCMDYRDRLILPGLVDLHLHAPQYAYRGLGMDLELIDWLNEHAFAEEQKYADTAYAEKAYGIFAEDLANSATTRACIFATIHTEATLLLMELLEKQGFCGYVGKVNMDRNSPDSLREESAGASARETVRWIEACAGRFTSIKPMLTPRFTPSCSDELMEKLGEIRRAYDLPVQSHLSENLGEIAWVRELCPETSFYGESYDRYGLFGGDCKTIMAHCVHSGDEELRLMKERGVFAAHCPQSNTDLASGIAPVRKFLELGISTGLGTDVAGGFSLSMFRAVSDAIQCSKLRWRLTDQSLRPLNMEEAFYLATKGGGAFFGNVGSFEEGFAFDAVVMDDSRLRSPLSLSLRQRLERLIYLAGEQQPEAKYVDGKLIFDRTA